MAIDKWSDPGVRPGDPPGDPAPRHGSSLRARLSQARRPTEVAGLTAWVVVGVDAQSKWFADTRLPGAAVELGVGRLQLSHNTGVAFSLGDGLPAWAVLGLASVITLGVGVAIVLGYLRPPLAAGLVLGGALGNILDRTSDGSVTDFLWLGWFPTFNLADTAITLGALGLLWAAWRGEGAEPDAAAGRGPVAAP